MEIIIPLLLVLMCTAAFTGGAYCNQVNKSEIDQATTACTKANSDLTEVSKAKYWCANGMSGEIK